MPDEFERYFKTFGHAVSDFYSLRRLEPSYRVFFEDDKTVDMPATMHDIEALFEGLESGSVEVLRQFLAESKYKYEVGMQDMVYRPSLSLREFADHRVLRALIRLHMFRSLRSSVRASFHNTQLQRLLEFPVLFLGAKPDAIPAMYSMMNYADLALGTWYPMGGMHEIIKAMVRVAEQNGVDIRFNEEVQSLQIHNNAVHEVRTDRGVYNADYVVAGADYHHVEQSLLPASHRSYSERYCQTRTMAPSSLLYYVGLKTRLSGVLHHNLFFDRDFDVHAEEIYDRPQYPSDPLFYLCVPSKTDPSVAPDGCENLFILVPTAVGLQDSPAIREQYFQRVMKRIAERCGRDVRDEVVLRRDYASSDFVQDYHSFRGNAYGLANTLRQTAFLKPKMRSKKVKNLFYTGQLTVPGPGVPPSLVSGQVVASLLQHESTLVSHTQYRHGYQRTL